LTSGIGQAPPTELLLVPLKTDEELLGVLELASVRGFQPHEIEFVKMVSSSIASTLLTAQSNQRNADLLQQAQAQQVQMREQEEEMRQNLEEIQATQEEMERRTHEVEVLRSAVREGMLYGELNEAGVWLTANHKIEEIYRQMGREGIEGTQFVANTDWQSANGAKRLETVWDDVRHGGHIEGEFTLHTQNSGDRVVRGILYPNRNEDGTLLCVYFIGVEIAGTQGGMPIL
ncbi:MAG: GAF domain-containing protein, partial [Bacteroides sp.]